MCRNKQCLYTLSCKWINTSKSAQRHQKKLQFVFSVYGSVLVVAFRYQQVWDM